MLFLFYTIHVVICLFLILVVLLQQGKGADLSVFGGGGTMTAFGARGAATLLHKMTVFAFVGFIVTTLTIGILQKQGSGSSVMTDLPTATATTTDDEDAAEEAEEAGALPEAALPEEEVPPAAALPEDDALPEEDAPAGEDGAEDGGEP